jgi:hypothetical protein
VRESEKGRKYQDMVFRSLGETQMCGSVQCTVVGLRGVLSGKTKLYGAQITVWKSAGKKARRQAKSRRNVVSGEIVVLLWGMR